MHALLDFSCPFPFPYLHPRTLPLRPELRGASRSKRAVDSRRSVYRRADVCPSGRRGRRRPRLALGAEGRQPSILRLPLPQRRAAGETV